MRRKPHLFRKNGVWWCGMPDCDYQVKGLTWQGAYRRWYLFPSIREIAFVRGYGWPNLDIVKKFDKYR